MIQWQKLPQREQMNTYQITPPVLEGYRALKLTNGRIEMLINQANEQLNELQQNQELYGQFLEEITPPTPIDNTILWMLIMCDEDRCDEYNDAFNKGFRDIIPVNDLADLLLYSVYLKKVENSPLDGFEYLLSFKADGMEEVDQCAFTNTFLYIQQTKEPQIEF